MIEPYRSYHPNIDASAFVHQSAVVIGQVTIGAEASIWPLCVLRGDVHQISVGARSNIQDGTICHVTSPSKAQPEGFALRIGADVTVGHQAILHGCTIGARCLIGMGALLLDGAVLADEVFVAAGSLVAPGKQLESGWLYQGRPAKPVRKLTDAEIAGLLDSSAHYVDLQATYTQA